MRRDGRSSHTVGLCLFAPAGLLLAASLALAEPITYTGFVITDGQLGTWRFHNARVILSFASDTNFVQQFSSLCPGTVNSAFPAAINGVGAATVTIVDHDQVKSAVIQPGQLFVYLNQSGGGVGFGTYGPGFTGPDCSNPLSLQTAYPLGVRNGTVARALNLQGNIGSSGKGYNCVGVPTGKCDPPTTPIHTDTPDDLYLAEPYQTLFSPRSLNGAFFIEETGRASGHSLPPGVLNRSSAVGAGPITYHMLLISNVWLNGELFQNAAIHLSFHSHISNVVAGANPNSVESRIGEARVEIKSGARTESAKFASDQIYVYFDPPLGVGFASNSGGAAYPAVLAPTFVNLETELFPAVRDILISGSTGYSQPTIDLAKTVDLKQETMLADYVSSCTDFNFLRGFCNNLPTSEKLITDRGDFILEEPYNVSGLKDPSTTNPRPIRSSNNWGVFWVTYEP